MRIEIKPPADINLNWLEARVRQAVEATMLGAAQVVANEAKKSIARGPKTGRVYTTRFKTNTQTGKIFPTEKRVPHQSSAPGEPPATDTGKLVSSIVASSDGVRGIVEARAAYAVHLEYGTRSMAARPFLMRAFEGSQDRIGVLVRAAVSSALSQYSPKRRG